MNNYLKKKFGLTESGVKSLKTAIIISVLVNIGYMAFVSIGIYFAYNVLNNQVRSLPVYLGIIAIVTGIVYFIVDMDYIKTYNATYAEATQLRLEIADQIKKLPLSYFSKHDLSDMAQTIMTDVSDIEHALSHAMSRCIGYGIFVFVIGIMLLINNIYLGLATVIPLAIGFLLMYCSKTLQEKWTSKYFWQTRKNVELFQETIELQREIKSYGLKKENYDHVSKTLDESEKMRMRSEIVQAGPLLLSSSFMKLVLGSIAFVSATLLRNNAVDIIFVIGYLLAGIRLIDAIGAIEEGFAELLYIGARVKRIQEIRNTEIQQGRLMDLQSFDIELKNVEFSYNQDIKVIDHVSFIAKQGEVTAIVGPSGCGKSTLLRLISRLYDYDQGNILIDSCDIKEIATESLFDKVSMVFQDVILFNASILDNIRIGRSSASDEEIKEAARMANCEEFILSLPDGYDTMIGENGSKLSGGERQRLSIARAFLKNAPIILLDEISASLDVENEMKIQHSLNQLIKNKTVIVISHRLKSIEQADKIIVMEDGRIESMGTHDELMKSSPLYQRLKQKSILTDNFVY
ncbi:MAG: ABC transporter ATP-binding protein [Eggerthia catenaformis]|uniref:ABC transporter ATP-binding protein n=1 Tax=Eggerthia catenaformis TaxID=31973 RepID=UPI003FA16F96